MSIRFALKVSRKQQSWFASKSFANDADYKTFMKEVEKTPKLVVVDWYDFLQNSASDNVHRCVL